MSSDTESEVTNYLIRVRKSAGLTQAQLAQMLNTKQVTVSTREHGIGTGVKGLDVVRAWAAACGGRARLVLEMPGEVPATAALVDAVAGLDREDLALLVRAVQALRVLPRDELLTEVEIHELRARKVLAVREQAATPYGKGA